MENLEIVVSRQDLGPTKINRVIIWLCFDAVPCRCSAPCCFGRASDVLVLAFRAALLALLVRSLAPGDQSPPNCDRSKSPGNVEATMTFDIPPEVQWLLEMFC